MTKTTGTPPRAHSRIWAFMPAHNEAATIADSIRALQTQSRPPERIVVVLDNCTDDTAVVAAAAGADLHFTNGNTHKKAGALNQALSVYLPGLPAEALVLVQDADSVLDAMFVEAGQAHLAADPRLGAVSGTFRATALPSGTRAWERVLWHLQDNEYARYAKDVRNLGGKCLVVTGTAAMFRVETLRAVSAARLSGTVPAGDGRGGVYDTTVLTEDNELSFAIMTLGHTLLAPPEMLLTTEHMTSWRALWSQRLRWKRGAVENCVQYGLTQVTRRYWGRQALTVVGVVMTAVYLMSIGWVLLRGGGIQVHPFWLGVTMLFCLERYVTVSDKGRAHQLAAMLMYEMPYELFLQACHGRAYLDSLTRARRVW